MDKEEIQKSMAEFLKLSVTSWMRIAEDQGASLHAVARAVRELADAVIANDNLDEEVGNEQEEEPEATESASSRLTSMLHEVIDNWRVEWPDAEQCHAIAAWQNVISTWRG